jgi:hypothetical protein
MDVKKCTPTGYLFLLTQQISPSTTYFCWANKSSYLFSSAPFAPHRDGFFPATSVRRNQQADVASPAPHPSQADLPGDAPTPDLTAPGAASLPTSLLGVGASALPEDSS